MTNYTSMTIGGAFGGGVYEGDKATFDRVIAEWVVGGGTVGIWKVITDKDGKYTSLTVVGFYSRISMSLGGKSDENIIGCWAVTDEWRKYEVHECCGCGCTVCSSCQCCCESCESCGDCACCCDCT